MPLNYQCSSFTWRNCGFVRVACNDVACEQVLPLEESREATREQHAKEDASLILESYAEVDLEIPQTSWCSAALCPTIKKLQICKST